MPITKHHKQLLLLNVLGALSCVAYAYLAYRSQSYASATLFDMYGVLFFAAIAQFVAFYVVKDNTHLAWQWMFIWAVAFRAIGVSAFPVLEDDFYRYLWDGRMLIETGSVYSIPPAAFFTIQDLPERFAQILDHINYPHINTVYGPVCQYIFALAYIIAPGESWPLQAIFALCDLALIFLLARLAPTRWVLLYAWCPLVVKEFAFTAHPDILGILFLIFAVYCWIGRYYVFVAISLAFAVGAKVFALLAIPFLLGVRWKAWGIFLLGLLIIYLPFINDGGLIPGGLKAMGEVWQFNAFLYNILSLFFDPMTTKYTLGVVFITLYGAYLYYYYQSDYAIFRGDWVFGLLLLVSPVVNAWYFIWLLPFAVLYPSYWVWVGSVVILLSYVSGINLPGSDLEPYQQPILLLVLQYVLVLGVLLLEFTKPTFLQRFLGQKAKSR